MQAELAVMKLRQQVEPQGMAAAVDFGEGIRQVPATTRHSNSFLIALSWVHGFLGPPEYNRRARSFHEASSRGVNMNNLQLKQVPIAKTGMLIRKPVADVIEAFVNPDITTRFWFTKGSGRLEAGRQVQWDWEMYGISIPVIVKAVEPNQRLLIEWPGENGPTTVEWLFRSLEDGSTFVSITNTGFTGDGDELVKQALGSTQGFSLVLAGLKALLEHGVRLNLVADRFPEGIEEH
jgi:uncharacterized protein YndB with AHSA1/START domain